jgi:hydroxymethylpyrimidine/phosphomethylpyrimidine kinase
VQIQTSPLILTFGATDPVGAAGIQADLASFAAMGCHGLSVVTSLLVGDTAGVEDLLPIDADWVADQARVVLEDMPVAAFKVGAVGSIENITVIAEIVSDYPDIPLILDPFSTGLPDPDGDNEEWLNAIRELLIPQTTVLLLSSTELSRLAETWREDNDEETSDTLPLDAMRLIDAGCEHVLITGAPTADPHEVSNLLFNESGTVRHDHWPRQTGSYRGAGTTLSAAITAMLANGLDVPEAILEAQEFTNAAIANAQRIGMGRLVPDRFFWARDPGAGEADNNNQ